MCSPGRDDWLGDVGAVQEKRWKWSVVSASGEQFTVVGHLLAAESSSFSDCLESFLLLTLANITF